jgi:Sec-independent protein translocase protein TatA
MKLFNIGFAEFILILIIMLVVLGPDQTIQQMKRLASFVRKVVRSPFWSDILDTSREIKDLPNKMLRESGLDEELAEINRKIRPSIDEIPNSRNIPGSGKPERPAENHQPDGSPDSQDGESSSG